MTHQRNGYKLLTRDLRTRVGFDNETDWSDIGVWHEAKGTGALCTDGLLHDYDDPWIAVVMNPEHANITDPICYTTERDGPFETDGLKCGSQRMRLIAPYPLPEIPLHQKIGFGILASLEVYDEPSYVKWAREWLSGRDRTAASAAIAARAASAAWAAWAYSATRAARATRATRAARAASAAWAAWAYSAARATRAASAAIAAWAAWAYSAARATRAARAASAAWADIDWQAIKQQAIQVQP